MEPPVRVAPFGLTEPELNSPDTLPPEMTNRSVALPQGVPTATETQVPSKLPPPLLPSPPLLRDARRGSSDSGLPRRAGLEGSAARGASREPDSDFSSLPMLPPALPDCARAAPDMAIVTRSEPTPMPIECRAKYSIENFILKFSNISCRLANRLGYCFDAVQFPVQPSDCRNVPPPLRPESRPVVITVMPPSLVVA